MKNIFRYMVLSLLPLTAASCLNDSIIEPMSGSQSIVLDLSCGNLTKAISAEDLNSAGAEGYVKHVDVLIFGEQAPVDGKQAAMVFHQRIEWNEAFFVDGTVTLDVKRNRFIANQDYAVYVIANSTYPEADFAAMDEESDLYRLVQTDANLHLTGLASSDESTDADTTPDFFLMEGRAYTSGTSAVLNDGNAAHNTVLEADLARAVSKVVVELTAGGKVQFSDPAQSVYHYRNLPYSTVTVPETGYEISPDLKSTEAQPRNAYVQWVKSVAATEGVEAVTGKITVTGYVYSYSWTALDKETSLIVNIPMTHTEGDNTTTYPSNYYKIPLSKDRKFERNHYYKVSAEVNAPGSESNFEPVTLKNLKYDTFPWVDILPPIEVGNETNKPKYLQLNTYHVDMNNIDTDFKTLEFSSSSAITSITLVTESAAGLESMTNTSSTAMEGYYVNKFGQPTAISTQIRNQINDGTNWGTTSDDGTTWDKTEINGNIKVYSPTPENNAPRYLVYKVTNADNMVAYFTVIQYPLEYITNIQGYYSYRSDYYTHDNTPNNPTTYEYRGDGYVSALWQGLDSQDHWGYYATNSGSSGYTFRSKVAFLSTDSRYAGKSDIDYYTWSNVSSSSTTARRNTSYKTASSNDPGNARMYHVQITSTSDSYVIGIPKLDKDGFTVSTSDNSLLVSPSFMIASQLGATSSTSYTSESYIARAKEHCNQYVETYRETYQDASGNPQTRVVHLDDWRLPTAAEIEIIVKFQTGSEVMDVVLAGANYFCASPQGYVSTGIENSNNIYIRCIRDAY